MIFISGLKGEFMLLVTKLIIGLAFAAQFNFSPSQGEVQFNAVGRPSMLKIIGKGEGLSGSVI